MAVMVRWALVALGLLELTAGEDPCVKVNTSYYDDSKPPVAVKYMANAIACQAACEFNGPCEAWTFLRDAGSCWQLPASQQMILVGNPNGESGSKLCRPHGRAARKSVWTSASLAAAPAPAEPPTAAVPLHILGAEPLLAEGGPPRPACASRGKALNDPMVQILNGGYVALATECQSRCASAPLCVFWTFYNDTGGCWLQGSNVTSFLNHSAISGPKLCDEPLEASPYAAGQNISGASAQTVLMRSIPRPGCSFRGKAYRDPQVKALNGGYMDTAEMCQDLCSRSFLCARFTYYIDTKACWLQGSNATEFESAMAIAGPKACGEPHPVSLKEMQLDTVLNCAKSKVARQGDELVVPEFMVKSDAVECQAGCKDTSDCMYFTFYPESHRCTLHGKDASTITSLDSISGPKECDDPVALPVGAWEVKLTRMASGWRSHAGPFMLVVVAASSLALTVVVCGRMSQAFARWGNSYRYVASRGNPRLDEDMEERFVEAA